MHTNRNNVENPAIRNSDRSSGRVAVEGGPGGDSQPGENLGPNPATLRAIAREIEIAATLAAGNGWTEGLLERIQSMLGGIVDQMGVAILPDQGAQFCERHRIAGGPCVFCLSEVQHRVKRECSRLQQQAERQGGRLRENLIEIDRLNRQLSIFRVALGRIAQSTMTFGGVIARDVLAGEVTP